jgi:ribose 5-phosphate isomerase B
MKIGIGTDHAGYRYKESIKEYLAQHGHEVIDYGTDSEESCDYPLFVKPVAKAVSEGQLERGIVLGYSGNGEAISANRYKGVRCALCWNERTAELSRSHNDSNVLSIGQGMIELELALRIVEVWLKTPFEGGRHERRIRQIDEFCP